MFWLLGIFYKCQDNYNILEFDEIIYFCLVGTALSEPKTHETFNFLFVLIHVRFIKNGNEYLISHLHQTSLTFKIDFNFYAFNYLLLLCFSLFTSVMFFVTKYKFTSNCFVNVLDGVKDTKQIGYGFNFWAKL